ncbi:hypothetical protein [Parafrankia sp. FMc2]|uniref:hypothetical protein n=1 Tax=Parafrankia sp. FMc2 TaxID=3233196 RepID=UPI0034D42286
MVDVLTEEDVEEIVFIAAGDGRHEDAAARFEDLAGQPELHGQITAAGLLVHACGQYGLADRWDDAVRCCREAMAAAAAATASGGAAEDIDPRVWLHEALMARDRARREARALAGASPGGETGGDAGGDAHSGEPGDEAAATRAEIRALRSRNPDVYAVVAETLAEHDLLQEAHTWFTMGYQRCQGADVPIYMLHLLLVGRRSVRRELGYPPDGLDLVADDYVNHRDSADHDH